MARTKQPRPFQKVVAIKRTIANAAKLPRKKESMSMKTVRTDGNVKVKKPHRFRPGTVALREIKKQQRRTDFAIRRAPFGRVVREIAQDIKADLRWSPVALDALQEAAEAYLVGILRDSYDVTLNKKKDTLTIGDLALALKLRGIHRPSTAVTVSIPRPIAPKMAPIRRVDSQVIAASEPIPELPVEPVVEDSAIELTA